MYRIAAIFLAAALAACSSLKSDPSVQTEDGLTRIDGSQFNELYIRSGTDFEAYDSIYAEPLVVEFDERWIRQQEGYGTYILRDADRERIEAAMRALSTPRWAGQL